eukprot:5739499-Pyramimonas_sp.AAC.1
MACRVCRSGVLYISLTRAGKLAEMDGVAAWAAKLPPSAANSLLSHQIPRYDIDPPAGPRCPGSWWRWTAWWSGSFVASGRRTPPAAPLRCCCW